MYSLIGKMGRVRDITMEHILVEFPEGDFKFHPNAILQYIHRQYSKKNWLYMKRMEVWVLMQEKATADQKLGIKQNPFSKAIFEGMKKHWSLSSRVRRETIGIPRSADMSLYIKHLDLLNPDNAWMVKVFKETYDTTWNERQEHALSGLLLDILTEMLRTEPRNVTGIILDQFERKDIDAIKRLGYQHIFAKHNFPIWKPAKRMNTKFKGNVFKGALRGNRSITIS